MDLPRTAIRWMNPSRMNLPRSNLKVNRYSHMSIFLFQFIPTKANDFCIYLVLFSIFQMAQVASWSLVLVVVETEVTESVPASDAALTGAGVDIQLPTAQTGVVARAAVGQKEMASVQMVGAARSGAGADTSLPIAQRNCCES